MLRTGCFRGRPAVACETERATVFCSTAVRAVCARWKRRDLATDLVQEVDEATPPFGETLLHAAAFAGHVGLLGQLLGAGARVSRTGQQSCCTALHAAAAGGNLPRMNHGTARQG